VVGMTIELTGGIEDLVSVVVVVVVTVFVEGRQISD
jgi:hypothetical protein